VRAVDPSGREFEEILHFEIVDERPQPFFRKELFAPQG
jgi:hypothetical protein